MLTGDTLFPSQDIEEDLQDEILNMDLDFPDYLETNEVISLSSRQVCAAQTDIATLGAPDEPTKVTFSEL